VQRLFNWLWLFNKRLYKKVSFVVILVTTVYILSYFLTKCKIFLHFPENSLREMGHNQAASTAMMV